MAGTARTLREWRLNAVLSLVLLLAILVLGNRLAREHVRLRVDLSEDRLYAPSDVGRRMIGELGDLLQVKAYFTGEARLGPVQIAKRRLIDQLEELEDAAGGRIELAFLDPNASSEARAEAQGLGIQAWPMRGVQGTTEVTQDVYLGILLRYRGREVVLPFVLPQTFEYSFLGGLRKLLREGEMTVGFLTDGGKGQEDRFKDVRALLAGQYRLRELLDLELGTEIPSDVSVAVVARPLDLHPRAVFALDQFLQRGGRALVLLDDDVVDLSTGKLVQSPSGLAPLLEAWGVELSQGFVWDGERANRITTRETIQVGGEDRTVSSPSFAYPFWPNVGPEGLASDLPATARLPGADLFWVRALEARPVEGLSSERLVWSSPTSWVVPFQEALTLDPNALRARGTALLAREPAAPRTMALFLSGRYPSPFAAGAPAPVDAIEEALYQQQKNQALAEGREPPARALATTSEEVLSDAASTQLVVVGDADWASDGKFLKDRNRMLFVNLVDWLALEDDLIELRSRIPRERTLDDLLEEERHALGLSGPRVEATGPGAGEVAKLEAQAERNAARRRLDLMLLATGGALGGALLLGVLWRLTLGRPVGAAGRRSG